MKTAARIKLADVKAAEREWAITASNSTCPERDLAVSRAIGRYQDIAAAYAEQKRLKDEQATR